MASDKAGDAARDETGLPPGVREHIDMVAQLEDELARQQSGGERIADAIAGFVGTTAFVAVQVVLVLAWVVVNSGRIGLPAVDPFPFSLLNLAIALEAVLLTTFVLIKQSRMSRQADRRAHLALQVTLLTERETTKIIQMLARISDRMGIDEHAEDGEAHALGQTTAIDEMARDLHERLPIQP